MNSKNRVFFVIGVGLAILTAWFMYSAASKMENLVPVVVATQQIEPHTKITSKMVHVEEIPAIGRSDISIDDPALVIDGFSTTRIFPGQTIIQPMVGKQFDAEGASGLALSIHDPSLRAISFPVDGVSAVGGKIQKGDFVDIIASFDAGKLGAQTGVTKTIYQNVEVFDVVGKDDEISALTLLVDLPMAEVITHAYSVGTVTYALTPGNSNITKTTGVINSQLCERYGFRCEQQR